MDFMMKTTNYYIEIKWMLYGCILALTTLVGITFANTFKVKYEIYNELYLFLNYYNIEIGFSKNKLSDIINSFLNKQTIDYLNLNEVIEYVKKGIIVEKKFKYKNPLKYLNESQLNEIENIFNDIGKYDLINEKANIEGMLKFVSNLKETALYNKNKYYSFFIKLGIIAGCFITILFI